MAPKLRQKEKLTRPKAKPYNKDQIRQTYDALKKKKPPTQRAQLLTHFQRYKKIWAERQKVGTGETLKRLAKNTWEVMKAGFEMFKEGLTSIKSKGRLSLLWLMHKISPGSAREITRNAVSDSLRKEDPVHRTRLTKAADSVYNTYDKALTSSERSQFIDGIQNAIDYFSKPKAELHKEFNPGELATMGTFGIKALYRLRHKYGPKGLKKILESAQAIAKKRGKKSTNLARLRSLLTANGRLNPQDAFLQTLFPKLPPKSLNRLQQILAKPSIISLFDPVIGQITPRLKSLLGPKWSTHIMALYNQFKREGASPDLIVRITELFKQRDLESIAKGYCRRLESAHLHKKHPKLLPKPTTPKKPKKPSFRQAALTQNPQSTKQPKTILDRAKGLWNSFTSTISAKNLLKNYQKAKKTILSQARRQQDQIKPPKA